MNNGCLRVKLYKIVGHEIQLQNKRRMDIMFKEKICLSEDGKKLAVFA
jgi:hypothetical protein